MENNEILLIFLALIFLIAFTDKWRSVEKFNPVLRPHDWCPTCVHKSKEGCDKCRNCEMGHPDDCGYVSPLTIPEHSYSSSVSKFHLPNYESYSPSYWPEYPLLQN